MSRRSIAVCLLLTCLGASVIAVLWPAFAGAQPTSAKAPVVRHAAARQPDASSLWPLLALGIGLFVASGLSFWAASALERASRSAMHIARAAQATLLTALATLLI